MYPTPNPEDRPPRWLSMLIATIVFFLVGGCVALLVFNWLLGVGMNQAFDLFAT